MIKKAALVTVVSSVSFFLGAWWTCTKVCEFVNAGIDVNVMAQQCMNRAEKDAEVRVSKWRRKYSEIRRK